MYVISLLILVNVPIRTLSQADARCALRKSSVVWDLLGVTRCAVVLAHVANCAVVSSHIAPGLALVGWAALCCAALRCAARWPGLAWFCLGRLRVLGWAGMAPNGLRWPGVARRAWLA